MRSGDKCRMSLSFRIQQYFLKTVERERERVLFLGPETHGTNDIFYVGSETKLNSKVKLSCLKEV